MAVTIKHKNTSIATLVSEVFGSSGSSISLWDTATVLTASGHVLRITPTTISIIDKHEIERSKIGLQWGAVSLAIKGKLGKSALTVVRSKITTLIHGVEGSIPPNDVFVVDLGKAEYSVVSQVSPVVALKDATQLHQSVRGTSSTSRYHVIALSSDIKVAVRIKDDFEISIRAICMHAPQSKKGQKAKLALLGAGLDKKKGGHYSLHLEPDSLDMAVRSIGSTLFSIDSFPQMSGNLKILVGLGS